MAHVHPCVNYEWIKIQLKMNLNLIKSELELIIKVNWSELWDD
jgi:hypothetical protein